MGVEQSGDVTFVNGVAAEQNTEGATPEGDHGDERAAAIAAVREALKDEGKKAAKEAKESLDRDPTRVKETKVERGEDGKFKSVETDAAPKAKPEPDEETGNDLKKALASRKAIAQQKAAIQAEHQRAMAEINQQRQEMEHARQEVARERQKLEMLRKDPIRAIKENGWDAEQFILDIAQDGTPEGQARRQARELQQQIQEMHDWRKKQEDDRRQFAEQHERQKAVQYRQLVTQEFLKTALNEDAHPHLSSFYGDAPDELVVQADVIADKYRALTGKEATFQDIAEYLEERAEKWYKKQVGRQGQQTKAPATTGRPTQGSATGRTLSPDGSSERRSLGKTLKDLDGDERLAAAREAVASAINASGER